MLRSLTAAFVTGLALSSSAYAQTTTAPQYLGILAGAGGPQQPADTRLYGTDLGWTFSHAGQLYILFGDSWRTSNSLCDVQTQGIDLNDDSQATLPSSYPGSVPSMSVATQAGSKEFDPIVVTRDGRSLDMSTNRTPLTGFSDGQRPIVALQSGVFAQCNDASGCSGTLQCSHDVGVCQPALLNLSQLCDMATQTGCYQGQRCGRADTGYCVDPTSAQPQTGNKAALQVEIAVPDAPGSTHYKSKHTWATNKFENLASRTIERLGKSAADSDFRHGTNVLLAWGRPGYFASEGLALPMYLLAHELPIADNAEGKIDFRPS